ncbi:hypothetical protein ILUMI_11115 [Ignelater luminosus]|uniref:Uncharacterized protein n=1 Tax=Ignelater luminosus TaxID=2038154 RepID=A0A8K0CWJ6_IGNLU|nr:hypothetical protein ILUMI_11115 [Ignelater luminosus]
MEAEQDVLQGVQQELVKLNMIYDLDEKPCRYTALINIECESNDVHASDEDNVKEPCCSREPNKTPIATRQTVRANVIEMSPIDEKELATVQSIYSDDGEACCSKQCNKQLPKNFLSAYFKAGRKRSSFESNDEKTGIQTNFLIDEANDIGKGPNATISMLHHYLETHPSVDTLIVFADNCMSQNKNNGLYITRYHHFTFIGKKVFCKQIVHSEEEEFHLQIFSSPHGNLPPVIQPAGLYLERQSGIYISTPDQCDKQDLVAPKPEVELNKNKRQKKE